MKSKCKLLFGIVLGLLSICSAHTLESDSVNDEYIEAIELFLRGNGISSSEISSLVNCLSNEEIASLANLIVSLSFNFTLYFNLSDSNTTANELSKIFLSFTESLNTSISNCSSADLSSFLESILSHNTLTNQIETCFNSQFALLNSTYVEYNKGIEEMIESPADISAYAEDLFSNLGNLYYLLVTGSQTIETTSLSYFRRMNLWVIFLSLTLLIVFS